MQYVNEMKDVVKQTYDEVVTMNGRRFAHQVSSLALIVCSAIMIWKTLCLVSGSESPVVVVLSGSMLPAFTRGDILFLWFEADKLDVGEIVVFKIRGRDTPIVHRILETHTDEFGVQRYLTKGDHNPVDDRGLYNTDEHQIWLERSDIMGRAKGFLPYVGMVTINLTEYPWAKYALIGVMGVFVITAKE